MTHVCMFDQMKPLFSSQITSFQRESMSSPKTVNPWIMQGNFVEVASKAKLASLFGRVQVQVDPLALPAPPLHLPNLTMCGSHMSASATGRGKGASTFPARDFPSPPPPHVPSHLLPGRKEEKFLNLSPSTDPAAQPPSRSDKVSSSAPSLPRAQIPPRSTQAQLHPAAPHHHPQPSCQVTNDPPLPFLSA
jgi:hypothetical protein